MALMFGALNYGNTLRYHIRAQSAADSAAQAVLALQSQRWNEMMELLYGLDVEEYRIRTLLNGIVLAAAGSGGCYETASTSQAQGDYTADCEAAYQILIPKYTQAVNRYTAEASLLHKVATNATFPKWYSDAQSLMAELQSGCNPTGQPPSNNAGGDCAFQYNWSTTSGSSALAQASAQILRSQATTGYGLQTVYLPTATQIDIPSFGNTTAYGTDTENQQLFAPIQVDVITCAQIPAIVPNFFKINLAAQPTYAIGRASATNVLFVQDWFEPGALINPDRVAKDGGQVDFQPPEYYGTPQKPADQEHDFYAVDFGGNASAANTQAGAFRDVVQYDEMSVRLGWWNSIPIHPVNAAGAAPTTATKCPTTVGTN